MSSRSGFSQDKDMKQKNRSMEKSISFGDPVYSDSVTSPVPKCPIYSQTAICANNKRLSDN